MHYVPRNDITRHVPSPYVQDLESEDYHRTATTTAKGVSYEKIIQRTRAFFCPVSCAHQCNQAQIRAIRFRTILDANQIPPAHRKTNGKKRRTIEPDVEKELNADEPQVGFMSASKVSMSHTENQKLSLRRAFAQLLHLKLLLARARLQWEPQ